MPGPRPALCTFPDDFLQVALDTVSRRTVAIQTVQRFSLVLLFLALVSWCARRGGMHKTGGVLSGEIRGQGSRLSLPER